MAKPSIKPQVINFLIQNPTPISTKELFTQMNQLGIPAGNSSNTLLELFNSDLGSANPQFIRIYPKPGSRQKVCLYALNPPGYTQKAEPVNLEIPWRRLMRVVPTAWRT